MVGGDVDDEVADGKDGGSSREPNQSQESFFNLEKKSFGKRRLRPRIRRRRSNKGQNLMSIPKFDGDYEHWKMLMENLLRSKEWWHLIEPGYVEPTVGTRDRGRKGCTRAVEGFKEGDVKATLGVHEEEIPKQRKGIKDSTTSTQERI
ncbi:hypothetical protein OSB04_031169 [Centaurea solstitialis]|uniref:Uncharacterized protein n=1 Tax=Centaurea solstitialis TaxID=347529 RepID=A0AA38SL61_9ASTR|nr:hypothetical protein OSB04_031169 [Centaurea solstitialis]